MTARELSIRVAYKVRRMNLSRIKLKCTKPISSPLILHAFVCGIQAGAYLKLGRWPGKDYETDWRVYSCMKHAIQSGSSIPDALREGGLGIP